MAAPPVASAIAEIFGQEWPRLLAILRSEFGDLDAAEDACQAAFEAATTTWTDRALPDRPGAWLLTTARRHAIDGRRRQQRFDARREQLGRDHGKIPADPGAGGDEQLAMIFGCCHRSLDRSAQVALTLRYVCGLTTEQIGRAFLTSEATMAKRLVRAKHKIRAAGVPFVVPDSDRLQRSLGAVLDVIYLIFSEGYSSSAATLVRGDLVDEAAWLAGHISTLVPDEPEPKGLEALIAFTDARRSARLDSAGELVLLEFQDRDLWDQERISRGHRVLESALRHRRPGPYQLQAAVAAVHSSAVTFDATDWRAIAHLYRRLHRHSSTPVVALNLAVALAMDEGPRRGLEALDAIGDALETYQYFHAARADFLRRLGNHAEAAASYRRAIETCRSDPERRFLARRLAEMETVGRPERIQSRE